MLLSGFLAVLPESLQRDIVALGRSAGEKHFILLDSEQISKRRSGRFDNLSRVVAKVVRPAVRVAYDASINVDHIVEHTFINGRG